MLNYSVAELRIIAKLQKKGLLKRVGGRKYGEWLVFI